MQAGGQVARVEEVLTGARRGEAGGGGERGGGGGGEGGSGNEAVGEEVREGPWIGRW